MVAVDEKSAELFQFGSIFLPYETEAKALSLLAEITSKTKILCVEILLLKYDFKS